MADMKQFIDKIYRELAELTDKEQMLEQKKRVEDLLAQYNGEDRVILSDEYMHTAKLEGQQALPRMMTSIPTLDKCLNGFKQTDLVVISAPTGVGKTTFCQTLIENLQDKNVRSLLLSYEVAPEELVFSKEVVYALPAQLKGDTLEWIEKKIIEAKVKHDVQVAFIDHLHYISDVTMLGKGQNMSTVIGITMSKLALMAKKYNVAIFLVAHLKKTRFDAMPDMSDLRDSSFIAQYADVVLMMVRQMEDVMVQGQQYQKASDTTVVSIQKARGVGRKLGTFAMKFGNNKLYEVDEDGYVALEA